MDGNAYNFNYANGNANGGSGLGKYWIAYQIQNIDVVV